MLIECYGSITGVAVDRATIFSTAKSYTDRNVVHVVHTVHVSVVHVVLVVVNNLIRALYNIIMKTTVTSGGKLPVP